MNHYTIFMEPYSGTIVYGQKVDQLLNKEYGQTYELLGHRYQIKELEYGCHTMDHYIIFMEPYSGMGKKWIS